LHNSVLPERVHEQNKSGQKYIEKWLSSSIANEITLSRFDFEETCEFIKNVLAITTSLPLSVRKCSVTPKETRVYNRRYYGIVQGRKAVH